ncbi:hypothetical protein MMC22_004686 [Lobaria immixta]|nr:hypothetical protein [Lobaria immixta]
MTAISGWYHTPQEGEKVFVEGLEDDKISLRQFEGKADEFDLPKTNSQTLIAGNDSSFSSNNNQKSALSSQKGVSLSENDFTFLIKYIAPTYLTPETLESVSERFNEWFLTLDSFLSDEFAQSLHEFITIQESQALPIATSDTEKATPWTVARPPHKHRFLYQQVREPRPTDPRNQSPLQDLLENLLPSLPFYKWLQSATGQTISSHNLIARRFRRGKDYTLPTGYEEDESQLEITLVITLSSRWEPDMEVEDEANSHVVASNVGETADDSVVSNLVDEEHVGKPEETPVEADNHVVKSNVGEAEVAPAEMNESVVEQKLEPVGPGNLAANANVEEVKGSPTGAGTSATAGIGGNSDKESVDAATAEVSKSHSVGTVSKSRKVDVEAGKLFTNGDAREGGNSDEVDKRATVNEGVGDVDEAGRETDNARKFVANDDVGVGGDLAEVSNGALGLDIGGYLAYTAGDDTDPAVSQTANQGDDDRVFFSMPAG